MELRRTAIAGVCVLEPQVFGDARGYFFESFNRRRLEAALGRPVDFVRDNHSTSTRGVLRGLHYQLPRPQAKLARVVRGEVFDVAVDLRRGSPTLGRCVGETISAENRRLVFLPEGVAHGFLVLSEAAEVPYETNESWHPEHERCLRRDDPGLSIAWPRTGQRPVLSAKDAAGLAYRDEPLLDLPGGHP